ncbi:MAG: methyltransferase, partial [Thermoplasmata archaeon]
FSIDPKDYWRFRKRLEEGLSGSKKVELFRVGERAILAERVNS